LRGVEATPRENVMPSLGVPELAIIFLIIIVLFGANKIPQIGKGLGEGIKNFKKGIKDGDEEAARIPEKTGPNP
jgi:sec-independent protein translocase protein TatA